MTTRWVTHLKWTQLVSQYNQVLTLTTSTSTNHSLVIHYRKDLIFSFLKIWRRAKLSPTKTLFTVGACLQRLAVLLVVDLLQSTKPPKVGMCDRQSCHLRGTFRVLVKLKNPNHNFNQILWHNQTTILNLSISHRLQTKISDNGECLLKATKKPRLSHLSTA